MRYPSEHVADVEEPHQLEPVVLLGLLGNDAWQSGYDVEYEVVLDVVFYYHPKVGHPLNVFLVSCEKLQDDVGEEDDVYCLVHAFVVDHLVWLVDVECKVVHASIVPEKQEQDAESIPHVLGRVLVRHDDNVLKASFLLLFVFSLAAACLIIDHVGDWLVHVVAHYFLCHLRLVVGEGEEVYFESHVSNVVP